MGDDGEAGGAGRKSGPASSSPRINLVKEEWNMKRVHIGVVSFLLLAGFAAHAGAPHLKTHGPSLRSTRQYVARAHVNDYSGIVPMVRVGAARIEIYRDGRFLFARNIDVGNNSSFGVRASVAGRRYKFVCRYKGRTAVGYTTATASGSMIIFKYYRNGRLTP